MTLDAIYERLRNSGKATSYHMPAIRDLAKQCNRCVEFGIRTGPTTVALLKGTAGTVHSYDVEYIPQWHDPIKDAAGDRWVQHYESSYKAQPFDTDLMLHDSFHNYSQVKLELERWGNYVRRFMIFHDTISCGLVGEGIAGGHKDPIHADKRGIRLAIDEWMIKHPSWRIYSHDPESHGLLVLWNPQR